MALRIPAFSQAMRMPCTKETAPMVSSSLPLRRSSSLPSRERTHSMGAIPRRVSALGRSTVIEARNISVPLRLLQDGRMQSGHLVVELFHLAEQNRIVGRRRSLRRFARQAIESVLQFAGAA